MQQYVGMGEISDTTTSCIRGRLFEDEVIHCFAVAQLWSWFKVILFQAWWRKDQNIGGGLGVLVRGFPCLHVHYFTPTSAADFLLILPVGFSSTLHLAEVSLYSSVCLCTSQGQCPMSECSLNESILVNSISAA